MNEQNAPRILISRMSAIGDAILTLPLANAIREHIPDAYIAWVVERKAAPMVRQHVALNSVIELERGWFTSPRGIRDARSKLRSHQFDISIDCQGLTKVVATFVTSRGESKMRAIFAQIMIDDMFMSGGMVLLNMGRKNRSKMSSCPVSRFRDRKMSG